MIVKGKANTCTTRRRLLFPHCRLRTQVKKGAGIHLNHMHWKSINYRSSVRNVCKRQKWSLTFEINRKQAKSFFIAHPVARVSKSLVTRGDIFRLPAVADGQLPQVMITFVASSLVSAIYSNDDSGRCLFSRN